MMNENSSGECKHGSHWIVSELRNHSKGFFFERLTFSSSRSLPIQSNSLYVYSSTKAWALRGCDWWIALISGRRWDQQHAAYQTGRGWTSPEGLCSSMENSNRGHAQGCHHIFQQLCVRYGDFTSCADTVASILHTSFGFSEACWRRCCPWQGCCVNLLNHVWDQEVLQNILGLFSALTTFSKIPHWPSLLLFPLKSQILKYVFVVHHILTPSTRLSRVARIRPVQERKLAMSYYVQNISKFWTMAD